MMAIFEFEYRVEEVDNHGRRLETLIQSQDFYAACAAYESLCTTKPKARLMLQHRSRTLKSTSPLATPERQQDDCGNGMEPRSSMCGRYAITSPAAQIHALFKSANPLINIEPRYNAAPTQTVPVIRRNPENGERSLDMLRWGLIPSWAKSPSIGAKAINARAEGLADKPMFRESFAKRRCLVPATAFYEWQPTSGRKIPYAIGLATGETMGFAGLWSGWRSPTDQTILRTFTIITTTANELMTPIHDRMPVVLPPATWSTWLGETTATPTDLQTLLQPYPAHLMRAWRVGEEVGSVKNDRAELLVPLAR